MWVLVEHLFNSKQILLPKSRNEYLKLAQSIVNWCEQNVILGRQRKSKVLIKISYQKKGDLLGWYDYNTKTIMVYVLKHKDLQSIVNTTIHEYVHHLQLRTIRDDVRYNSISKLKGYWDNDFEVEAREISSKLMYKCIKELKKIK